MHDDRRSNVAGQPPESERSASSNELPERMRKLRYRTIRDRDEKSEEPGPAGEPRPARDRDDEGPRDAVAEEREARRFRPGAL